MKWRGAAWLLATFLIPSAAAIRAGRTGARASVASPRAKAASGKAAALRLLLLETPVGPEVRDAALAAAGGVAGVSDASVNQSTAAINAMLRDARWQLDRTMMECSELKEQLQSEAEAATAEVQATAMTLGQERAELEKAAMEIPAESEWFQSVSFYAKLGRRDCEKEKWERKARARAFRADAQRFRRTRAALAAQCAAGSNFLQLPSKLRRPCSNGTRAGAEAKAAGARLPSWSRRLRPPVRRQLWPILLQLDSLASSSTPPSCHYERRECPELLRGIDTVLGEVADGQRRLKLGGERSARDCARLSRLDNGELREAAERRQDYSKQLARATSKMNVEGREEDLEDSRRMALEERLMAVKSRCKKQVDDLLQGQICGLRNVRDQLWLLLGRTELPEDCEVTDWREGPCSRSCGRGTRTLFREVISPAWGGGVECPPLKMTRPCGEPHCPTSCVVSLWSGWSACSAECGGGLQQRTRSALTQASNGGDACPNLVDVRMCNTEACRQDCRLGAWSPWSPCSRVCGGGERRRRREVEEEASEGGRCPEPTAEERLQSAACNVSPCAQNADLKCAGAPLDVVLVVEAGCISASTFQGLKSLASELIGRLNPQAGGTQVGIVAFSNAASLVSGLSPDGFSLQGQLSGQVVSSADGPCMLSSGLATASTALFSRGRREAVSVVLVLTAGFPSDTFLASQAAARLRRASARLLLVPLGVEASPGLDGSTAASVAALGGLVSAPAEESIFAVPTLQTLQANASDIAFRVVSSVCSELAAG